MLTQARPLKIGSEQPALKTLCLDPVRAGQLARERPDLPPDVGDGNDFPMGAARHRSDDKQALLRIPMNIDGAALAIDVDADGERIGTNVAAVEPSRADRDP
jgi:hypothetical protein